MTLNYYDITNYSPFNLRINLYLASKLSHFKRIISFSYFKNIFIIKILTQLTDIYLISEGLRKVALDDNIVNDNRAYPYIKKTLDKYQKLYSLLEKVAFFDKKNIEEISEKTLSNLYKTEAHIRMKLSSSNTEKSYDDSLIEFATSLSLGTFQA